MSIEKIKEPIASRRLKIIGILCVLFSGGIYLKQSNNFHSEGKSTASQQRIPSYPTHEHPFTVRWENNSNENHIGIAQIQIGSPISRDSEPNWLNWQRRGEMVVLDMESQRQLHPPMSWSECTEEIRNRASADYAIDLATATGRQAAFAIDQQLEVLGQEISDNRNPETGMRWAACSENLERAMEIGYRFNRPDLAREIFLDRLAHIRALPNSDEKPELLEELLGNTFSTYPELLGHIIVDLSTSEKALALSALQLNLEINRLGLQIDNSINALFSSYPSTRRQIQDRERMLALINRLEFVQTMYFPSTTK